MTSVPAGIDCGSTCSAVFAEGSFVTVTATPSPGSVFVGWDGYCYGPQPTCTLTMWNPWTITAYFNPPSQDKPLTNHTPLKDSIKGPITGGTWNYYFFDVGSGNNELVVDVLDMSGDASLFVKFGVKPQGSSGASCVDHSSATNNRRCVVHNPAAGRWWIGINNQDENVAIQYTLRASWGNASDRELANRSTYGDFLSAMSLGAAWKYYFVDLAAGSTGLTVDLTHLSADADLYIRHGAKPDRSNNDCASTEGSTLPDRCTVSDPAAGRWWIGINNFSVDTITYKLTASWQTVDTPADFYLVSSCRILDTRSPSQPLVSGVPRSIQIAGLCGIPSTARAVVANVTVTGGTGAGYLTLHPGDEGVPATSTQNFGADQTRANSVMLKLDGGGAGNLGALATVAGSGQVHVLVDVSGYYE